MERRTRPGTGKEIVKFFDGVKPMTKTVNPILSLAVVMALALAAVFGAMSLTGTAQAAVDQSADAELTERVDSPQSKPSGLSAEGGDGEITLTFNDQTDPAIDATEWQVNVRSAGASGNDSWTATNNSSGLDTAISVGTADETTTEGKVSIVVSGLSNGTTYVFRVRANDSVDGVGPVSEEVEVTPNAMPSLPRFVKAVVDGESTSINLTWVNTGESGSVDKWEYTTDLPDAGADAIDATSYLVTYAAGTDSPKWTKIPGTTGSSGSGKITLKSGSAYRIVVRGVKGDSAGSAGANIEGEIASLMAAPARNLRPERGNGMVTLKWDAPSPADGGVYTWDYQYREVGDSDWEDPVTVTELSFQAGEARRNENAEQAALRATRAYSASMREVEVPDLDNGTAYEFRVRAKSGSLTYTPDDTATTNDEEDVDLDGDAINGHWSAPAKQTPMLPEPVVPMFVADSTDPGDSTLYTLDFMNSEYFNGGLYPITIKLEGFGVPGSISSSAIAVEVTEGEDTYTFNPATVTVDGKEIILTVPDVARSDNERNKRHFAKDSAFKVLIYQSAGVTNPTEKNTYGGAKPHEDREIFVDFGDSGAAKVFLSSIDVPRIVEIDPEDGGLGETVTVTGKGFKNGTTLTVFLDRNRNGNIDSDEDVLCVDSEIDGGDIGTCEFEVTHPAFRGGSDQMNYINAVDGRNGYVTKMDEKKFDLPMFELGASISASPAGGKPGERILIQMLDFPKNVSVSKVEIGRVPLPTTDYSGSTDSNGAGTFAITIPNNAKGGMQELRVTAGSKDASLNLDLQGPRVVSTPSEVRANQRISLVGTGFSPNSRIGDDVAGSISKISIGSHPIPWRDVNDGRDVHVDDGGNWSASVDLPVVEATTGGGERVIRITDSMGRRGTATVSLAERSFDITPPSGRVGTLAVVRGMGYPSKNDDGYSFTIDVLYKVANGSTTRVSVLPDASGRFEVQLRIPTSAAIPSSNQVEVSFSHQAGGSKITDVKQHMVPEGALILSETSGGPGSTVLLKGEGFKSFVPVGSVKIGNIEVTPTPRPSTDVNGMLEFDILIPGLEVGIQTIEVQVGQTTASVGFTVTESGIAAGAIKLTAAAIEELGENLVSVWHFNNDTKTWSFYDPALMEGNTLTHMITGETYLIRIKSTVEVILNRNTRNLTCVGGNCWNQIVW